MFTSKSVRLFVVLFVLALALAASAVAAPSNTDITTVAPKAGYVGGGDCSADRATGDLYINPDPYCLVVEGKGDIAPVIVTKSVVVRIIETIVATLTPDVTNTPDTSTTATPVVTITPAPTLVVTETPVVVITETPVIIITETSVVTATPEPTQVVTATPEPTQAPTEAACDKSNPGNDKCKGTENNEHCDQGMCENGNSGSKGKSTTATPAPVIAE